MREKLIDKIVIGAVFGLVFVGHVGRDPARLILSPTKRNFVLWITSGIDL